MRKVWIYKIKGIKRWWVGWYESGKRKAKALPTKKLAEHYCQIKYSQLNSEVFTGLVTINWQQMAEEYRHSKRVAGIIEVSLYETALTLRHFERLVGKCNSKQITQNTIDKFILQRGNEVKRPTLNKDIRNLRTFINWCRENRYLNGKLKIKELKEDERPVKSLDISQIRKLLSVSEPNHAIYMRILLALGTGLRRGDIENIKVSDIDFMKNCITTNSKKTKKTMASRPAPSHIIKELKFYVDSLSQGQELLFTDVFSYKKWNTICNKIQLPELKFHDLRKTFASVLAQCGVSTAVTQRLLEHSSSALTNKIYTNVDPVLRQSVDQLPIEQWLQK
jgi:integrase